MPFLESSFNMHANTATSVILTFYMQSVRCSPIVLVLCTSRMNQAIEIENGTQTLLVA